MTTNGFLKSEQISKISALTIQAETANTRLAREFYIFKLGMITKLSKKQKAHIRQTYKEIHSAAKLKTNKYAQAEVSADSFPDDRTTQVISKEEYEALVNGETNQAQIGTTEKEVFDPNIYVPNHLYDVTECRESMRTVLDDRFDPFAAPDKTDPKSK